MGELHSGPKHPLSGADPEPSFDLNVVPPGYQPKGEGDCGYMAQYNHAYSWFVGFVSLGRLPTYESGTLIISPQAGEAHQPWLATHLGEGNTDFKPMARGTCWQCPSFLGHDSCCIVLYCISCFCLSSGALLGLSGCGMIAFPCWFFHHIS